MATVWAASIKVVCILLTASLPSAFFFWAAGKYVLLGWEYCRAYGGAPQAILPLGMLRRALGAVRAGLLNWQGYVGKFLGVVLAVWALLGIYTAGAPSKRKRFCMRFVDPIPGPPWNSIDTARPQADVS